MLVNLVMALLVPNHQFTQFVVAELNLPRVR
jgi:hypothetical protein